MADRNLPVIAGGTWLPVPLDRMSEILDRHGHSLSCRVAPALRKTDSMDVSHGGRYLCASDDKLLLLWQSGDIAVSRRYWLDARILSVSLGYNEAYLCAGLDNGAVVLIDIQDGDMRTVVQRDTPVCHVGLDRKAPRLAWSDAAGQVSVYDFERAQEKKILYSGPRARVWLDLDGSCLIVDNEREVSVFEVESGARMRRYRFAPDTGRSIDVAGGPHIVARQDNRLHVWNYETEEQEQVLYHPGYVSAYDIDRSIGKIVSVCDGDMIHVHEPLVGRQDAFFDYTPQMHSIRLRHNAVYVAGNDPSVGRIELDSRSMSNYFDQTIPIISAKISDAGKRLTTGDSVSGVTSYDLETGYRISSTRFAGAGSISSVDVCGQQVAAGAFDGCVRLLGQREMTIKVGDGPVQAVALTEDRVFSGNYEGRILCHDLVDGSLMQSYPGHHLNVRTLRVHGTQLLAAGEEGRVSIFDIESGRCEQPYFHGIGIYPARFDDEARCIFAGDQSGAVVRWDVASGQQDMRYAGHSTFVRGLHYGNGMIGGIGLHGDAQVWDANSGELLFRANIDNERRSRFIYFDDAFTRVVVTGADGMFRCFDADSAGEVARGYHMAAGFHWVAFRDGETDWIWSDQQQWLEVRKKVGQDVTLLAEGDQERLGFLQERNSQTHTMHRVGLCVPQHLADLAALSLPDAGSAQHTLAPQLGHDAGDG